MSSVVLDNEAVQALLHRDHPKRKAVLTMLNGRARRARSQKERVGRWVPTTVRVEAGWDRRDPASAEINGLRILDRPLDADLANRGADIVSCEGVSPADAHLGATVEALGEPNVVVLTSDPEDMERVCPAGTRIVRI